MNLRRSFARVAWGAALLIPGACLAQAQLSTPTRVPTTTLSPRTLDVTIDPTVNGATPRSPTISIGAQPVTVTLNGSQLGSVTAVHVVDSSGTQQSQIQAHIVETSRAAHTLPLRVFAKKNARPGRYRLQLSLPADPRQVQTRPQGAPLSATASRTLDINEGTIALTVRAMEPKITSMTPSQPAHSRQVHPYMIVADVPGDEVISISRYEGSSGPTYCRYRPNPSVSSSTSGFRGGVWGASWTAPATLKVLMIPGEFDPAGSCHMRLSIKTKSALGEEFQSFTPSFLVSLASPPPRVHLPVSSTWALKSYLYLPAGFSKGVCNGTSIGAHGTVPVGIVNVNGKLGFRARSGPIGTECHWTVATNRLDTGWALHMNFRVRRIGDKCKTTDGSTPQFDFSALRHATILKDGEYSLYTNLNFNGDALKLVGLRCDPTLSNDHEVLVEMVSASVSTKSLPRNDCDWRCAFR